MASKTSGLEGGKLIQAKINTKDFNLKTALTKELKGVIGNDNKRLEIGFFDNAKYENGVHVASVASFQEFGTLKIPMRPFFRNAIKKNGVKWFGFFKNQFSKNKDFELSLNQVGEIARGDIIESINNTNTPPLAESTIRRKGSSKPLIDTGLLRASVSYKVVK